MNKNELWQLIQKSEKKFARRKIKRFIFTVLFYAVVFFAIEYFRSGLSILELAGEFVACVIISIPFVLFNSVIFYQLFQTSKEEEETLKFLRKRLKEKEQEDNH